MSPLVHSLTARAFHRATAATANAAIDAARELRSTAARDAVSYEVVVPSLAVDEFLVRQALPKLVYFLDCRGLVLCEPGPAAQPGAAEGPVFVSLFLPEGLFFIDAGVVARELGAAAGLAPVELVRRYGANGQGDPLLLGA